MIRIRRGAEPPQLAVIRTSELARIRALVSHPNPTSDEVGTKYQAMQDRLWRKQRYKCCYCEHLCQRSFHDVEHYRPKARANRGPGFPTHGYWWLAWTWSNLSFACPGCNRSGKNDEFPLAVGSVALVHESAPPGGESALFIDPSETNAVGHIQFRRIFRTNLGDRWVPLPRAGSARGAETIRVAELDRDELLDLYEYHYENFVLPELNTLQNRFVVGNAGDVLETWTERVVPLRDQLRPYSALSFDIIDQTISRSIRRQWGLSLRRP